MYKATQDSAKGGPSATGNYGNGGQPKPKMEHQEPNGKKEDEVTDVDFGEVKDDKK